MNDDSERPDKFTALRRQAEERLAESDIGVAGDWTHECSKLLHELQTHQIELEIQNEELREVQQELALARDSYLDLYEKAPVGYLTLSAKFVILKANLTLADMLETSRAQLIGKPLSAFVFADDQDIFYLYCRRIVEQQRLGFEIRLQRGEGLQFWARLECELVAASGKHEEYSIRVVLSDVTEIKEMEGRLRAKAKIRHQNAILAGIGRVFHEALVCETEKDVARTCLEVLEAITGSGFGFIGEVREDGRMHDLIISDPGWQACTMKDQSGHRIAPGSFVIHGLYGKVLRDGKPYFTNTPVSHPASIGIPQGHPVITSFLGVPLMSAGKTMGLIALANREGGYRQQELDAAQSISGAVVQVLLRKRAEMDLVAYQQSLETMVVERTTELEQSNIALKVLLKKRESDRQEIEEQMVVNVKGLADPILDKLKRSGLTEKQLNYVAILEANLNSLIAPFLHSVSSRYLQLTPAEMQVAELVRQGKSTKEIAALLNLSPFTVSIHRQHLRKKFGIAGSSQNLRSFLASRIPKDSS